MFTGAMDARDAQDAQLRVVDPVAAAMARGARVRRDDGDRREVLLRESGPAGVRLEVSARTAEGRARLEQEARLLEELASLGLHGVPRVLERQADGYLREAARPLGGGRGRRIDRDGTPSPSEREAQSRARADMDDLLDALHARGLVLGLPAGEGLAARDDGTVLVDDLCSLRPSTLLAERLADQRWLDSVLQDQGRTLRRRVDEAGPASAEPSSPWRDGAGTAEQGSAPPPARRDPPARRGGRSGRSRPRPAVLVAGVSATAVLAAVAVLVLAPTGESPSARPVAASPAAPAAPRTAPPPQIEDPQALLSQLASRRHDYVLGRAEDPPAVPGSPAAAQDEAVREGYRGTTVEGWSTVVHEASVLEQAGDGTATLEARIEESPHAVLTADGERREVAGSGVVTVRVELEQVGGQWRIREVVPG